MLPPGSGGYTTAFKPVISITEYCCSSVQLAHFDEKIALPDFNLARCFFVVHWASTVLPGPNLWAEYWQQVGLSAIPPHSSLTHCSRWGLDTLQTHIDATFVWERPFRKKEYTVLHCNEFLFRLPIMAKYLRSYKPLYLCLPISPFLQNQSQNDLQLWGILSLPCISIFPSRRDEKIPRKMDGMLNLSRDNALLT